MQSKFLVVLLALLCAGCSTHPTTEVLSSYKSSPPSWVTSIENSKTVYGIGASGIHVDGKEAQKRVALLRAIDNLALQHNVHVKTVQNASLSGNKNEFQSSIQTQSEHTIETTVKAVIVDVWDDDINSIYYVRVKSE
jgi:uncharacterized protein YcfL